MNRPRNQPAPAAAIASKRAEKAENRRRIAAAINRLRADEAPVNVRAVARLAEVHPDTIRRNEDLYGEIRTLRGENPRSGSPSRPTPRESADLRDMTARFHAARTDIQHLRAALATAQAVAHQELGNIGPALDRSESQLLKDEAADLRVQLTNARALVRDGERRVESLQDELDATRELARDYLRELTAAHQDSTLLRKDLSVLKIQRASDGRQP